jgi:hypothetical protein
MSQTPKRPAPRRFIYNPSSSSVINIKKIIPQTGFFCLDFSREGNRIFLPLNCQGWGYTIIVSLETRGGIGFEKILFVLCPGPSGLAPGWMQKPGPG